MNKEALRAAVRKPASVQRPPLGNYEITASAGSQIPQVARDLLIWADTRPEAVADALEVGLCMSGTACCRISNLQPTKQFVGVDPFGDVPYRGRGSDGYVKMYPDDLGRMSLSNLFAAGNAFDVNVQYWKQTSVDFLQIIAPRGFVSGGLWRPYLFSSAFLDGSHESVVVGREIDLLMPYLHPDGIIIIDNMDYEQPDGSCLAGGVLAAAARNKLSLVFVDGYWNTDWDPVAVLSRDPAALTGLVVE